MEYIEQWNYEQHDFRHQQTGVAEDIKQYENIKL